MFLFALSCLFYLLSLFFAASTHICRLRDSDFLPPEMRLSDNAPEANAVLVYLFAFFVALFTTPIRTAPFVRPTAVNLKYVWPLTRYNTHTLSLTAH